VDALEASSKTYINLAVRAEICDFMGDFFDKFSSPFNAVRVENDDERFESLIEEDRVDRQRYKELRDIGIVMCGTFPRRKRLELSGTGTEEDFYAFVISQWGFENPRRYFGFLGPVSFPIGKLDSA